MFLGKYGEKELRSVKYCEKDKGVGTLGNALHFLQKITCHLSSKAVPRNVPRTIETGNQITAKASVPSYHMPHNPNSHRIWELSHWIRFVAHLQHPMAKNS